VPTCFDLVQNGDETDVDCGGSCGATCKDTGPQQQCKGAGDCLSHVCTGGLCQPPTCSDAITNGNETDVDCGGTCDALGHTCAANKHCAVNADCKSNTCFNFVCQATCADGTMNGNETDVDCGGTCDLQNLRCSNGKHCLVANDCSSLVCTVGICAAPNCADGVQNGAETGLDCGGGTCPSCPAGQGCTGTTDCQSKVCTGSVCQAPSCFDGVQNGGETDKDCGGATTCPLCVTGLHCIANGDCTSGVCSNFTCAVLTQGAACGVNSQCGTNNCVNGVCCNTACNGSCMACTHAYTGGPDGTCNAVHGKPDPSGTFCP
jgi:hypothetical protein